MKKNNIELIVGIFVLVGIACMVYTSVKLGQIDFLETDYYPLKAVFTSVSGLRQDTDIEISGVKVGKVQDIKLQDYQAVVTILVKKDIAVPQDTIASIKTKGVLGERYIELSPGGSDIILNPGDMIFDDIVYRLHS